jgi:hypothetical protein
MQLLCGSFGSAVVVLEQEWRSPRGFRHFLCINSPREPDDGPCLATRMPDDYGGGVRSGSPLPRSRLFWRQFISIKPEFRRSYIRL